MDGLGQLWKYQRKEIQCNRTGQNSIEISTKYALTIYQKQQRKKITTNLLETHHFSWWKIDVKVCFIKNEQNSGFPALKMGCNCWKSMISTKISTATEKNGVQNAIEYYLYFCFTFLASSLLVWYCMENDVYAIQMRWASEFWVLACCVQYNKLCACDNCQKTEEIQERKVEVNDENEQQMRMSWKRNRDNIYRHICAYAIRYTESVWGTGDIHTHLNQFATERKLPMYARNILYLIWLNTENC